MAFCQEGVLERYFAATYMELLGLSFSPIRCIGLKINGQHVTSSHGERHVCVIVPKIDWLNFHTPLRAHTRGPCGPWRSATLLSFCHFTFVPFPVSPNVYVVTV